MNSDLVDKLAEEEKQMRELVERLKACDLPESMGLTWDRGDDPPVDPDLYILDNPNNLEGSFHRIWFEKDDKPGTALFIVRGLMALESAGRSPRLREWRQNLNGELTHIGWLISWCWTIEETSVPYKEPEALEVTMAQAVANALIQTFPPRP